MPGGVGAFAPDPATGTEAGPGPTTPRRSAVRRASRLRGRAHASQAWRRALLRDTYQGWTSLGAPPIPSFGGAAATKAKRRKGTRARRRAAGAMEDVRDGKVGWARTKTSADARGAIRPKVAWSVPPRRGMFARAAGLGKPMAADMEPRPVGRK